MTIEVDGMLWKPVPGTTVTAEEFIAARSLVREIHSLMDWNPWVTEDRAQEYQAALETSGQWTRAEPGFERKTAEEYEAEMEQRLAEVDMRIAEELAQTEKNRTERAARYDPERAQARLELLEAQGILADQVRERDEIISRELFPAMDDNRRQDRLARLETAIATMTQDVERLAAVVGDPETVPDERGWLPAERRELALTLFSARRNTEVRELRSRVPDRQAELKTLKGQSQRAPVREALRKDSARLAYLEAMPPMGPADMCSECVSPAWHSMSTRFSDGGMTGGPCPAWPRWAQKVDEVRRKFFGLSGRPAEPRAPPPGPIAMIEAGMPIEDVMAQLAAIQADHPGAQVRQGRRNRWEIWPPGAPQP